MGQNEDDFLRRQRQRERLARLSGQEPPEPERRPHQLVESMADFKPSLLQRGEVKLRSAGSALAGRIREQGTREFETPPGYSLPEGFGQRRDAPEDRADPYPTPLPRTPEAPPTPARTPTPAPPGGTPPTAAPDSIPGIEQPEERRTLSGAEARRKATEIINRTRARPAAPPVEEHTFGRSPREPAETFPDEAMGGRAAAESGRLMAEGGAVYAPESIEQRAQDILAHGEMLKTIPVADKMVNAVASFYRTTTGEMPAGLLQGSAWLATEIADILGADSGPISEHKLFRAGEIVQAWAERTFPGDERLQKDFVFNVLPGALGSFGLFVALSFLSGGTATFGAAAAGLGARGVQLAGTAAQMGAAGAAAGLSGAAGLYNEALEMGGDAEAANEAAQQAYLSAIGESPAAGRAQAAAQRAYEVALREGVEEEEAQERAQAAYRELMEGSPEETAAQEAAQGAYQQEYRASAEDTARLAARWGVGPGIVQVFPVMRALGRFNPQLARLAGPQTLRHALKEGGLGALEEGIVETLGQGLNNKIAQELYDEDRHWAEGLMVAGGAGAGAGFISSFVLSMLGVRTSGNLSTPGSQQEGMHDPYHVLGIRPDASDAEIHAIYRKRAKEVHPDVSSDPRATVAFQNLTAAYEAINQHRAGEGPAETRQEPQEAPREPQQPQPAPEPAEAQAAAPEPTEAPAEAPAPERPSVRRKVADLMYPEGSAEREAITKRLEDAESANVELERRATDAEDKALRHSVTGLYGARAWDGAKKRVEPDPEQAVVFLDVDGFKQYNDKFGMEAGDEKIREAARTVQQVAGELGIPERNVYAIGGDEFLIVTPTGTEADVAARGEEAYGVQERAGITTSLSAGYGQTLKDAELMVKGGDGVVGRKEQRRKETGILSREEYDAQQEGAEALTAEAPPGAPESPPPEPPQPEAADATDALPEGLNVIQTPSGRWTFAGKVPNELSYERRDGAPMTPEEFDRIKQFGLVGKMKDEYRSASFGTRQEAVDAANRGATPEPADPAAPLPDRGERKRRVKIEKGEIVPGQRAIKPTVTFEETYADGSEVTRGEGGAILSEHNPTEPAERKPGAPTPGAHAEQRGDTIDLTVDFGDPLVDDDIKQAAYDLYPLGDMKPGSPMYGNTRERQQSFMEGAGDARGGAMEPRKSGAPYLQGHAWALENEQQPPVPPSDDVREQGIKEALDAAVRGMQSVRFEAGVDVQDVEYWVDELAEGLDFSLRDQDGKDPFGTARDFLEGAKETESDEVLQKVADGGLAALDAVDAGAETAEVETTPTETPDADSPPLADDGRGDPEGEGPGGVRRPPEGPRPPAAPGSSGGAGTGGVRADAEGGRSKEPRPADVGDEGSRGDRSEGRSRPDDVEPAPGPTPPSRDTKRIRGEDYALTPEELADLGGPKQRARQNLAAIKIVKQLAEERRPATQGEQAELAKFVGWGGLADMFEQPRTGGYYGRGPAFKDGWETLGRELKELLTEEEYRTAERSTQYAHYTSPEVIAAIYSGLERLGVDGNVRALEPGAGVGHFVGLSPFAGRWTAVEMEHMTADILGALYPSVDVHTAQYQDVAIPDGTFDIVVGNPPFGNIPISDKRYGKRSLQIHDYFFVKSLDKLREGGILAFVTSTGTMDKANRAGRQRMGDRADFLGAVRLPGGAFRKTAGTDVTTDIIFFRKRPQGENLAHADPWMKMAEVAVGEGDARQTFKINEYFVNNPDMVLGDIVADNLHHRRAGVAPRAGEDLSQAIATALERLPEGVYQKAGPTSVEGNPEHWDSKVPEGAKDGQYVLQGGKLQQVKGGRLTPLGLDPKKGTGRRVAQLVELGEAARKVVDLTREVAPDAELEAAQKRLTKLYDAFVKKHGPINKKKVTVNKNGVESTRRPNLSRYNDPVNGPLVRALEAFDEATGVASKTQIHSERLHGAPQPMGKIDTAWKGVVASLVEHGRIDMPYVVEQYGKSEQEIVRELGDKIFMDPQSGLYETPETYLSGNVKEKLAVAKGAAGRDSRFKANVEALEKAQPKDVTIGQMKKQGAAQVGVNWIAPETYIDFVNGALGMSGAKISFREIDGKWSVNRGRIMQPAKYDQFSTTDVSALKLFSDMLNAAQTRVYVTIDKKKVEDKEASALAEQAKGRLQRRFERWVYDEDDSRADALHRRYNDLMNHTVLAEWNGEHLRGRLPGIASHFRGHPLELASHQLNVAWRVLASGNTLIAHEVGAGKTIAMIIAGMEAKRMGLARKPMYVVPNSMLGQFSHEILEIYPSAKVLVADDYQFHSDRRSEFLARVASDDWDAVVLTHPSLKAIPTTPEFQAEIVQRMIAEFEEALVEAKKDADRFNVKELQRALEKYENKLKDLTESGRKPQTVYWEDLGVDMMFVDEAHEFKNLALPTSGTIKLAEAEKTTDLYIKTRHLERVNPGRGIVFATATPISNSIAEMYVMQRYLMEDRLRKDGYGSLDAWAGNFVWSYTEREYTAVGTLEEKFRPRKYRNTYAMAQMFRSIADVKTAKDLNLDTPPIFGGGPELVVVPGSERLKAFMRALQRRWDSRPKKPEKGDDGVFPVMNDGRFGSIDARLVTSPHAKAAGHDSSKPWEHSKAETAAERVFTIWKDTEKLRGTQMVFSDLGVPKQFRKASEGVVRKEFKEEFPDLTDAEIDAMVADAMGGESSYDLYNDIKARLVKMGVPAKEIAFIQEGGNKKKKEAIVDKMKSGEVRVLIGSTVMMGQGVNAQDRMVALHHIDVPYKPAWLHQRDGRIVRQGNLLWRDGLIEGVQVLRYALKGSYDPKGWQIIENKLGFIEQGMTARADTGMVEEVGGNTLSASDVAAIIKAEASDNPYAMDHAVARGKVQALKAEKEEHRDKRHNHESNVRRYRSQLAELRKRQNAAEEDQKRLVDATGDKFEVEVRKERFTDMEKAGDAILAEFAEIGEQSGGKKDKDARIGKYAGFHLHIAITPWGGRPTIFRLEGKGEYEGFPKVWGGSATGVATTLANMVERIRGMPAVIEERIEEVERDITETEELARQEFPQEAELEAARAEFAELDRLMSEHGEAVKPEEAGTEEGAPEGESEGEPPTALREIPTQYSDDAPRERFFSRLQRAIENSPQDKGTPEQWKGWLSKGVKKVEREWVGLDDYLDAQTGVLTREEVLYRYNVQSIEIREKVLSDEIMDPELQRKRDLADDLAFVAHGKLQDLRRAMEEAGYSKEDVDHDVTYSPFRPPAGVVPEAMYQEVDAAWMALLTEAKKAGVFGFANDAASALDEGRELVPGRFMTESMIQEAHRFHRAKEAVKKARSKSSPAAVREAKHAAVEAHKDYWDASEAFRDVTPATQWEDQTEPGGDGYREILLMLDGRGSVSQGRFRTNHFPGVDNIVMHIRMNLRQTSKGARAVHVEELQSDWSQRGRKDGFQKKPSAAVKKRMDALRKELKAAMSAYAEDADARYHAHRKLDHGIATPGTPEGDEFARLSANVNASAAHKDRLSKELHALAEEYTEGLVPPTPFEKTGDWLQLGARRVLQEAAASGAEVVTWTSGAVQVRRNELAEFVERLTVEKDADGSYTVKGVPKGEPGAFEQVFAEGKRAEDLPDLVGKEIAERIVTKGESHFEGEDLSVGGRGMRLFYDEMVGKAFVAAAKDEGFHVAIEDFRFPGLKGKRQGIKVPADMAGRLVALPMRLLESRDTEGTEAYLQETFGSPDAAKEVAKSVSSMAGNMVQVSTPSTPTTEERIAAVKAGEEAGYAWLDAKGQVVASKDGKIDNEAVYGMLRTFRHPSAEHLHVLVLAPSGTGNTMVVKHHRITSSGAIDMVDVRPGDIIEAAAIAKRVGGQVLLAHNHPSGDPTPSGADVLITRNAAALAKRNGAELAGHLVIDGETAFMVDASGGKKKVHLKAVSGALEWNRPRPFQASSPGAVFAYLRTMPPGDGRLDVLVVNAKNQVLAYEPMPIAHAATMAEWVPELLRDTGGLSVILGTHGHGAYVETVSHVRRAQELDVLEVVEVSRGISAAQQGLIPRRSDASGVSRRTGMASHEDRGEYDEDSPQGPRDGTTLHTLGLGPVLDATESLGLNERASEGAKGSWEIAGGLFDVLAEDLITVVAKQGPGGKMFARRLERALNDQKRLAGQLRDPFKKARLVSSWGPEAQRAAWWAQAVDFDGASGFARIEGALTGAIPMEAMPPGMQKWVAVQRQIHVLTGKQAEKAGLEQRNSDGETVPFQHTPGGKLFLRISTPELADLFLKPVGETWEFYIAELARLNDMEIDDVRAILDPLREANFSRTNMEIAREIPKHPTHMRMPNGHLMQILEARPHAYTRGSTLSQVARIAFTTEFGQGYTEDFLEQIRVQAVRRGVKAKDVDNALRALSGIPLDAPLLLEPGTAGYEVGRVFRHLVGGIRSGMLTAASIPNLPEFLGNIMTYGGVRNLIGGLIDLSTPKRWQETAQMVETMGVAIADVADMTVDRQRWTETVTRIFGNVALRIFPTKPVWTWQEKHGAAVAVRLAQRMMKGGASPYNESQYFNTLRWLGFAQTDARNLAQGKGTKAEYAEVARRFAARSNTTSWTLPAEESRAANSRHWRAWMWFTRYPQMRARSFAKATRLWAEALRAWKRNPSKRTRRDFGAATSAWIKMQVGVSMAGSGAILLMAFVMGGPEGLKAVLGDLKGDEDDEELEKWVNRGKWFAKNWAWAQLGPIITSLGRVYFDRRVDNWWMASAGASTFAEFANGVAGWGPYSGMEPVERAARLADRVAPGPRRMRAMLAVWGIGQRNAKLDTATREYWRWYRQEVGQPARIATSTQSTDRDAERNHKEFRAHMRRAYDVMRQKDAITRMDEIQEHVDAALAVGGKERSNATASLRARRLLSGGSGRPALTDEQKAHLRKTIGDELFAAIKAHDDLINRWAAPAPSSDRPSRPRSQTRPTRPTR